MPSIWSQPILNTSAGCHKVVVFVVAWYFWSLATIHLGWSHSLSSNNLARTRSFTSAVSLAPSYLSISGGPSWLVHMSSYLCLMYPRPVVKVLYKNDPLFLICMDRILVLHSCGLHWCWWTPTTVLPSTIASSAFPSSQLCPRYPTLQCIRFKKKNTGTIPRRCCTKVLDLPHVLNGLDFCGGIWYALPQASLGARKPTELQSACLAQRPSFF